jgi:integrase
MSKRRRQTYSGCSLEVRRGKLRLRFRITAPEGKSQYVSRETGLDNTAANRDQLRLAARLVGAALHAGRKLADIDQIIGTQGAGEPAAVMEPSVPTGVTVREYFDRWIAEQRLIVRKAQARDYKRHMERYVVPALGDVPLAELKAAHVRGVQAELLSKGRSPKYVKNILSGSFRAMIRQAKADELVTRDIFTGLKWPTWVPPEPDPFTPDERTRIIEWFKSQRFGFHPGQSSMANRWLAHPAYHAIVHMLFWTGMRPSEAAGLQWGDIDLAGRCLHVRRSRHLWEYNAPKTRQARRRVELFPEVVNVLKAVQPLHVTPEMPVFTNLQGNPVEPNSLLPHWYRCLRALGIRQRGLYCMKDTFVTTALSVGVKIPWLEQQTGVRYDTLRRHYGKWVPPENDSELQRFEVVEPALFTASGGKLHPTKVRVGVQFRVSARNIEVQKMRKGGLEPEKALEMIEEFRANCCAVWRVVAQIGPQGPNDLGDIMPLRRTPCSPGLHQ